MIENPYEPPDWPPNSSWCSFSPAAMGLRLAAAACVGALLGALLGYAAGITIFMASFPLGNENATAVLGAVICGSWAFYREKDRLNKSRQTVELLDATSRGPASYQRQRGTTIAFRVGRIVGRTLYRR